MKVTLERIKGTKHYHIAGKERVVTFVPCTQGYFAGKMFMGVYDTAEKDIDYALTPCSYLLRVAYIAKYSVVNHVIVYEEVYVDTERKYDMQEIFYGEPASGKFTINGKDYYDGLTFDERPNGWIIPLFSFETASKLCADLCTTYQDGGEYICFYDNDTDTFLCKDDRSERDKPVVIGVAVDLSTEKGEKKVYDFGYSAWMWTMTSSSSATPKRMFARK